MAAKKTAKKKATSAKSAKPAKKPTKKAPAKKSAKTPVRASVVHWEIQARDSKRMQKFYAALFGWKIDANNPMNYGMVSSGGKDAIDGGIGGSPGGPARTLVYAAVADIDAVLAKAESLGGKTVLPRTDVGPVIMGIFADVEGNQFGLIEA